MDLFPPLEYDSFLLPFLPTPTAVYSKHDLGKKHPRSQNQHLFIPLSVGRLSSLSRIVGDVDWHAVSLSPIFPCYLT
jgi:hypothetical protein